MKSAFAADVCCTCMQAHTAAPAGALRAQAESPFGVRVLVMDNLLRAEPHGVWGPHGQHCGLQLARTGTEHARCCLDAPPAVRQVYA